MNRTRGWRAFTLVELVAVVTLLSIVVGVTTLSVRGMSDQQTLAVAADQIAAMYRLVQSEAAATGRPRMLTFDRGGCRPAKPLKLDGEWQWVQAPRMELVGKVFIADARGSSAADTSVRREPPWRVFVHPGDTLRDIHVEFGRRTGATALATIDPVSGVSGLRYGRTDDGGWHGR